MLIKAHSPTKRTLSTHFPFGLVTLRLNTSRNQKCNSHRPKAESNLGYLKAFQSYKIALLIEILRFCLTVFFIFRPCLDHLNTRISPLCCDSNRFLTNLVLTTELCGSNSCTKVTMVNLKYFFPRLPHFFNATLKTLNLVPDRKIN